MASVGAEAAAVAVPWVGWRKSGGLILSLVCVCACLQKNKKSVHLAHGKEKLILDGIVGVLSSVYRISAHRNHQWASLQHKSARRSWRQIFPQEDVAWSRQISQEKPPAEVDSLVIGGWTVKLCICSYKNLHMLLFSGAASLCFMQKFIYLFSQKPMGDFLQW